MRTYAEEHLVFRRNMCMGLTFVTELCLFFFGLLVQPDGLLFCLKWDKPRCFPSSTLSTTGFPVLTDLSLHSCTCFLLFLDPLLLCLLVPLYLPLSLSPFISLSFIYSLSLCDSLPDCAFHYSITSLTGDIKPLCWSCRPPCDKFADDYSLSGPPSIYHPVAGTLYLVMGKQCTEHFTNAQSCNFWLTEHYHEEICPKWITVRLHLLDQHEMMMSIF